MGISSFPAQVGFDPSKYLNKYVVYSTPTLTANVFTELVNVSNKKGRLNDFKVRTPNNTSITYTIKVTADDVVVAHFAIFQSGASAINVLGVTKRTMISLDSSTNTYYVATDNIIIDSQLQVYLRDENDGSSKNRGSAYADLMVIEDGMFFNDSLVVEVKASSGVTLSNSSVEYETN